MMRPIEVLLGGVIAGLGPAEDVARDVRIVQVILPAFVSKSFYRLPAYGRTWPGPAYPREIAGGRKFFVFGLSLRRSINVIEPIPIL
jgi:hypothetical protein